MKAKINGIEMNYAVSGPERAPVVLLHHPLATNLTVWDELTAALQPRYRVVRLDARGHGETEAPKAIYGFETLAADVVGLMDNLGIGQARFLGLSMGGMVGQYLGLLYPGRFHSLCLVSTSSNMAALGAQIWDQRIKTAAEGGMQTVVDGAMARWVAPAAMSDKPALVQRLRQMILSTPVDGYIGWCHAIRSLNVTDRLGEIPLPTQVVVGALDPATPPAAAELIHKGIRGSSLVVMPGVSHMLQVEEPDAFHAVVMPFLAAHGPSASA